MVTDPRALRLTLIASILGSSIAYLDGTVVTVALPAISDSLDAGLATQQWVVEAYLLTLSAFLLVGGSLGDLFGRRRVLSAGLVGFAATSLLCALAPSDELLIVGRALQGVAGALLVPVSLALISATFPVEQRAAAIGAWTAWTSIAFVIGPLGGGLIIDVVSWRWIFLINVPLVLVNLALVRAGVPETSGGDTSRRVDWGGAALCALGLAGVVFALVEQPARGWSSLAVLVPLVVGVVLCACFVLWESRFSHPMLPLGMFRVRNFAAGNLATLAVYFGPGAGTVFIAIFLQQVSGYSALEAGLALLPTTLVMWLLARRFGALADRVGPRLLMGFGPIVGAVGLVLMTRVGAEVSYWTDLLPGVLVFALGLSMTVAPLTATVLGAAEDRLAGVASGVSNAVARVSNLLAVALVGAVIAGVYGGAMENARFVVLFGALDRQDGVVSAIEEARDRPLSGGIAAVSGLDPGTREMLDAPIRAASVDAWHAGLLVSAGFMALGGVISLVGIANPPRAGAAAAVAGVPATEREPCRAAAATAS